MSISIDESVLYLWHVSVPCSRPDTIVWYLWLQPQATTSWMLLQDNPRWTQMRFQTASCVANIWITDVLSLAMRGLAIISRSSWPYHNHRQKVHGFLAGMAINGGAIQALGFLLKTIGVVENGRKKIINLIQFVNWCNLRMLKQPTLWNAATSFHNSIHFVFR